MSRVYRADLALGIDAHEATVETMSAPIARWFRDPEVDADAVGFGASPHAIQIAALYLYGLA